MLDKLIHWLESNTQPCFYKENFGIECPGCGSQRALIELLKGNLLESLKLYPALIPTIFLLVYLILYIIFKFKNGHEVLIVSFIIVFCITVISYIIKMTALNEIIICDF
ncbi:MAG: hypothetical protein C0594_17135 [Marinilabiliales bacterium]|nr:MAG: hypothetical protein C0594_17135 [Marinilabiliales bacterium]